MHRKAQFWAALALAAVVIPSLELLRAGTWADEVRDRVRELWQRAYPEKKR